MLRRWLDYVWPVAELSALAGRFLAVTRRHVPNWLYQDCQSVRRPELLSDRWPAPEQSPRAVARRRRDDGWAFAVSPRARLPEATRPHARAFVPRKNHRACASGS